MDSRIALDDATELTRTGDIWLFRGDKAADRAIQLTTNSPINHVGMAIVIEDLPPLMWHAELGRSLPDVWSGTHHRGVQLHDLRDAVLVWARKYGQRAWLRQLDHPVTREMEDAVLRTVARLDGTPGTVLILADSNYWAGCDTAFARTGGGQGSIRQPTKLANPAPGDAEAFTVANNLIPINGKQYEYYWAAGQLPSGVTKISYAFPDGRTTNAVIQGKYWLMQHQTATPWKEGTAPTTLIKVTLYGANGHALRDFLLVWGEDTCAQITHGC